MNTEPANEAKANFDNIYEQPTPHGYYEHLGRLDYSICDELQPFCTRAARLLETWGKPVRMLDIGSSYGINATTIKHDVSFAQLNRLLELNVSTDSERGPFEMREALAKVGTAVPMECCGVDVSAPALEFARRAGIHDHGISADLERDGASLSATDRDVVSRTNLLLCTGAIGYVTDRTFRIVLDAIGEGTEDMIALMTVLRVFDTAPIATALQDHGLASAILPDVLIPQRRFQDEREQRDIVDVLEAERLDASAERSGRLFARLLVATSPERLPAVQREMMAVAGERPTLVRARSDAPARADTGPPKLTNGTA